jgi:hypothetical protein
MRVRVYRNLNKGGLSIQHKTEKGWRVRDYALYVVLENCTFKVQEKGRQRVIAQQCKNVHAWVEGDLCSTSMTDYLASSAPEPYYNPYTQDNFTIEGQPSSEASCLKIFSPPREKATPKGKKHQAVKRSQDLSPATPHSIQQKTVLLAS